MRAAAAFARRYLLDALGALGAVVYALPSLDYPFGMDQPLHWYIGRRWLEGELPYVSGISTKPPGVFAIHALSVLVMGDHQYAVRVVDLVFVLLAGLVIGTFRARRAGVSGAEDAVPRRPGEIGAACLTVSALAYTFFDWNALGHPDLWQGVAMLGVGWVVVRAPGGVLTPRRAFVAGAVACLAVTLKHVAFVPGLAFGGVVVGLALRRRRPREALVAGAAFTGGVAAVLALVLLPFVFGGALDAFWEVMVELILSYADAGARAGSTPDAWLTYAHGLLPTLVGFGVALGGLAIARARSEPTEPAAGLAVVLTMTCAITSVVMQGRASLSSFEYHWLALIPALGLGIAYGLRQLAPRLVAIQLAVVLALGAAAFTAEPPWLTASIHSYRGEWAAYLDVERGELSEAERRAYYFGHQPLVDSYPRQARVARQLRSWARPGDTMCVDGYFGALHILTSMRCPHRFVVPPFAMEGALPRWTDEYERAMRDHPPTFFVTTRRRTETIAARESQGFVRRALHDGPRPAFVVLERR
ncbi:MAG: hypothetical protein H6719_32830 [Sandaracinaceae bacterium]|nr:hypothetical protein [Sandaracinaceae bacterium]